MSVNGAKMARLGSARLGSARLGSAVVSRLLFSVKLYYINLSDKIRKLGVLCPVSGFFFCGKGGALSKLYA